MYEGLKMSPTDLICDAADVAKEIRVVETSIKTHRGPKITVDNRPCPAPSIRLFDSFTEINNYLIEDAIFNFNFRILHKGSMAVKQSLFAIEEHELRQTQPTQVQNVDKYADKIGIYAFNWTAINFYHWLMQILTTVESVLAYRKIEDIYIITSQNLSHWQRDSIRLLGYDSIPIFQPEPNIYYQAKMLEISDFCTNPTNLTRTGIQVCSRLKSALDLSSSKGKKIYVSRVDASFRRVTNENELIEVLRRFGFDILVMGCMTLEDQIRAFHDASFVVGPHGQGMGHTAYCCHGTFVWELFPENFVTHSTVGIAATVGLQYHATAFKQPLGEDRAQTTDFNIDVQYVEERLLEFGLSYQK